MCLTDKQKELITKNCTVSYVNNTKERQNKGQFFTPAELTIKMIEKFKSLDGCFIDPCGGNGNLLVGLISAGVSPECIYYNELDSNEFEAGKKRLMEYGVPIENMTNFDALSDEFAECYSGCAGFMNVIMNPPYIRNLHLKILSKMMEIFQQ